MKNYTLHSQGDNWFHFRNDPESAMESFSVTFCHDGTVCMTGDYGCLSWRRYNFPQTPDFGFPDKETGINYFAEKVVRSEQEQKIKDWAGELAISDITETMNDTAYGWSEKDLETLTEIKEKIENFEQGTYGYHQMLEAFSNTGPYIDMETCSKFGVRWSDSFRRKFKMLQSVSGQIYEAIRNKKEPAGFNYLQGKFAGE